jgi:hypothetical protein
VKATLSWTKGSITSDHYPVLLVETGRMSQGRDAIVLSLSCAAYEEDRASAWAELQNIAKLINSGQKSKSQRR